MISTSSGCINRYKVIHEDYNLGEQCVFEKLSEGEKALMSEDTKRKLGRNYKGCFIRHEAEQKRVEAHNNAHSN